MVKGRFQLVDGSRGQDAAQREVWAHILEGYDFEDSTWDLATYDEE